MSKLGRLLLLLGSVLWAQPAQAHPHAWIDIATTVVLNQDGRIAAIEQEWLFDEFYSAFVIEDVAEAPTRDALRELAGKNLGNLAAYGYFTEVRQKGEAVPLGTVETYDSEMRDGRLWMRFTLPLAEPIDPRQHHVRYAVFDPSYWVEMAYGETDEARIASAGGTAHGCSLMPELPTITGGMLSLALSLDRDDKAPQNLGSQFATWVEVLCP